MIGGDERQHVSVAAPSPLTPHLRPRLEESERAAASGLPCLSTRPAEDDGDGIHAPSAGPMNRTDPLYCIRSDCPCRTTNTTSSSLLPGTAAIARRTSGAFHSRLKTVASNGLQ